MEMRDLIQHCLQVDPAARPCIAEVKGLAEQLLLR